jgi:hypothetical protein
LPICLSKTCLRSCVTDFCFPSLSDDPLGHALHALEGCGPTERGMDDSVPHSVAFSPPFRGTIRHVYPQIWLVQTAIQRGIPGMFLNKRPRTANPSPTSIFTPAPTGKSPPSSSTFAR